MQFVWLELADEFVQFALNQPDFVVAAVAVDAAAVEYVAGVALEN